MNKNRIYTCKDGRLRIYNSETKKVLSYPKILMEEKIGRKLLSNEQIHHIDGNPLNNSLDNLQIVLLGEHQKYHAQKYTDKLMICPECKKEFLWTAKQQSIFYSNLSRKIPRNKFQLKKPFCSKKCSGKFSRREQLRRDS